MANIPLETNNSGEPLVRTLTHTGKSSIRLSQEQTRALAAFHSRLQDGVYSLGEAGCACGSRGEDDILVAWQERYGLPIRTYICGACGILYSTPRMSADGLLRFYREEYRALYFDLPTANEEFFARQCREGAVIRARLATNFECGKGRTVFDIGCGAGGTLQPFESAGCEVAGCDYGEAYLDFGRTRGLNLWAGGSETLAKSCKADLVIARHVLEHLPDPLDQLTAWRELVKGDGLIYVEVPGVYRAYQDYRGMHEFLHIAHTFHFTLGTLSRLAARAGLELVEGDQSVWALFRPSKQVRAAEIDGERERIERFIRTQESLLGRLAGKGVRLASKVARSVQKRFS